MALYAISIRQARDLPPPFFRFCLTADTLGLSYILPAAGRIRDFHPLERALTGRTRKTPPSRYGSEASFIEVHWFDPAVQKIHIAYLLFCVKKSRTGNRRLSLPLVRLLFLRTARPPSRGYSIIPAHPRRIVKHGFPPRGIRISDGRSCCDFRPRRQRYPLRSVHSDNPLCVITSSQYMRRSQRSSPLHDP